MTNVDSLSHFVTSHDTYFDSPFINDDKFVLLVKCCLYVCSSQGVVYLVDEATGGLEVSHRMILSDRDYGGSPGPVGKFEFISVFFYYYYLW